MRYIYCTLAALVLLSCSKAPSGNPVPGNIDITVSIRQDELSRATDVAYSDESNVVDLQVFVFREGKLEDYKDAGNATSTTLSITAGQKTVWALVNSASLSGITDENELSNHIGRLSDNRRDAFVMSGSVTKILTDGGTLEIPVRRLVSRVSVGKVTTGFKYALADADLSLDAIWLVNVAADAPFSGGAPTEWVNKLGHSDSGYDALLYDKVSTIVNNNTPYDREHVFYPYPNPTETISHESTWCPRHTMLVLEVTLEEKKGYYAVELPVLERNKSYVIGEIHLIHRPGDNPYVPVETGEATVPILVKEWETGVDLGTITI